MKGNVMKARIMIVLISILLLTIINCNDEDKSIYEDVFSIYISDSTDHTVITSINTIQLNEQPFITIEKIASYNWNTHQITYTSTNWEELKEWGNLIHRIFVVIVKDERIYWGRFMDDLDSGVCQNPVIKLLWRHPDGRNTIPESIQIDRAYPEYFGSDTDSDLRNDTRIYEVLNESGKLVE